MEGDPAGVAAHHLEDHHPVVALGGGAKAVDRIHRDVHGGVETEGVVGGAEVVVDRLRHPDHLDAGVVQVPGDTEGVLAADRDQSVDAVLLEACPDLFDAAVHLDRVGAGGTEDGAAAGEDAVDLLEAERHPESPSSGPCHPSR